MKIFSSIYNFMLSGNCLGSKTMQLKDLYGIRADASAFKARSDALAERYQTLTGECPQYWFSSPGRAEIIGNHTDHNHGKVIVAAISCDILAAVGKRDDGMICIYSEGFEPVSFCVTDTGVDPAEQGQSIALARGVVKKIRDKGFEPGGFTAVCNSTVFRGAGVSSSAAYELLVCEILNELYLGGALSAVEKAVISQYAENVYFGKPCGLLDQCGISFGGIRAIDFADPEHPVVEELSPPEGYTLVITNTGGSHDELTVHYAAIREEMRAVAEFFGKSVLQEVPYEKFCDALPELRKKVSERAVLRAFHFYEENDRVELAAMALREKREDAFLSAVNGSGISSLNCLQNCFVPGSDRQPVTLALHLSELLIQDGAVRIHGGGFAGTIIAFVADGETERYVNGMSRVFGESNIFTANIRRFGAAKIDLRELL